MADISFELLAHWAATSFGWTPAQVAETDYGLLRAMMMMHVERERVIAEQAKRRR